MMQTRSMLAAVGTNNLIMETGSIQEQKLHHENRDWQPY